MKLIKPLVFNPYEFSRASPAYRYDSAGFLDLAEIDQLRLGYNPTTLEFLGPIIEGQASNYALFSDGYRLLGHIAVAQQTRLTQQKLNLTVLLALAI